MDSFFILFFLSLRIFVSLCLDDSLHGNQELPSLSRFKKVNVEVKCENSSRIGLNSLEVSSSLQTLKDWTFKDWVLKTPVQAIDYEYLTRCRRRDWEGERFVRASRASQWHVLDRSRSEMDSSRRWSSRGRAASKRAGNPGPPSINSQSITFLPSMCDWERKTFSFFLYSTIARKSNFLYRRAVDIGGEPGLSWTVQGITLLCNSWLPLMLFTCWISMTGEWRNKMIRMMMDIHQK